MISKNIPQNNATLSQWRVSRNFQIFQGRGAFGAPKIIENMPLYTKNVGIMSSFSQRMFFYITNSRGGGGPLGPTPTHAPAVSVCFNTGHTSLVYTGRTPLVYNEHTPVVCTRHTLLVYSRNTPLLSTVYTPFQAALGAPL